MQTISGTNIALTRGDTLAFTVLFTKDGEPYIPAADDVIRFAVSRKYAGEAGYKLLLEQAIDNETLVVTMSSAETKTLANGPYNYDIQITHGDGTVDTVISGKLEITGEVE